MELNFTIRRNKMITQDKFWLGINISYDELEIKKTLNSSDFKDLFKFIAKK